MITESGIKELSRHIPLDNGANGVIGITDERWLIVGPNSLEIWWQFLGNRYPKFVDPYVRKVLEGIV